MKTYFALAAVALLLSSCDAVVNVDYAKVSYGFLNHGNFEPGQVILWDSKRQTVTVLDNVGCTGKDDPSGNPRDVEVNYEYGVEVSGKFTEAQLVSIDNALKSRTSLVAKNMKQIHCRSMITSMTNYIAANPDAMAEWFFRDGVKNRNLYYLFVSDVAIGDSLELSVDKQAKVGGSFPVKLATSDINVSIARNSLSKFNGNGKDISLMFKVRIFQPIFIPNGEKGMNPSFRPIQAVDLRKLPAALRKS